MQAFRRSPSANLEHDLYQIAIVSQMLPLLVKMIYNGSNISTSLSKCGDIQAFQIQDIGTKQWTALGMFSTEWADYSIYANTEVLHIMFHQKDG